MGGRRLDYANPPRHLLLVPAYSDAPVTIVLGASEVSANLYCNSRTSVLGRLRDYLRLLMGCTLLITARVKEEKNLF